MDGELCVEIPSTIFGRNELGQPITIDRSARYNVAIAGQTIAVTFSLRGGRALGIFGLGVSTRMRSAVGMTSRFAIKVDAEAKGLGWRAGRAVQVAANAEAFTLTFT